MEFNDSHKAPMARKFPFGVSKVKMLTATLGTTDNDREFMEVFFTDDSGNVEESARFWFGTDKGAQYSFNIIKEIIIHNTEEAKKDERRAKLDKIPNTENLLEALMATCVGGEMWLTKYFNPTRTHEYQGKTYRDVDTNLYGYEPTLRPELMPTKQESNDGTDEVKGVFPGAEEVKKDKASEGWL